MTSETAKDLQDRGAALFHTPNPEELQQDSQDKSPEERVTDGVSPISNSNQMEDEPFNGLDNEDENISLTGDDRTNIVDDQIRVAGLGGQ